ncbi:alpha/beta fold hydrolase [Kitasatospora sp. NPDC101155]|uniref:alpha/beta fold hydrolase n=1 Tax=Kitasatospora sp. NPDC101155 TaxID=3364097 RepID=UPI0037F829F0
MSTDSEVQTPDGGHLWAERRGAGTPVVLLHGSGMDSRLWDAVVPELSRHHDVIRYDARGLGRSTPPERTFDDVEDLRAVLDHFGLDRAALVGLSMGGETALDFTLAHPERVTALALIGASVSGHDWPPSPTTSPPFSSPTWPNHPPTPPHAHQPTPSNPNPPPSSERDAPPATHPPESPPPRKHPRLPPLAPCLQLQAPCRTLSTWPHSTSPPWASTSASSAAARSTRCANWRRPPACPTRT